MGNNPSGRLRLTALMLADTLVLYVMPALLEGEVSLAPAFDLAHANMPPLNDFSRGILLALVARPAVVEQRGLGELQYNPQTRLT